MSSGFKEFEAGTWSPRSGKARRMDYAYILVGTLASSEFAVDHAAACRCRIFEGLILVWNLSGKVPFLLYIS